MDKLQVADGMGSLIQAALDAGVLDWPSQAMEAVMGVPSHMEWGAQKAFFFFFFLINNL
jgi:hypothetical protein